MQLQNFKRNLGLKPSFFILSIALSCLFQGMKAQTSGFIFNPASTNTVLDPNLDKYTSQTTAGFTTDDKIQSEIPYFTLPTPFSEPFGDLRRGSDCNATEIVYDANGKGAYISFDGTNLRFRMRMGGYSSGAFGFSILVDVDGKFGGTGPNADPTYLAQTTGTDGNPGFEYEITWEKNFRVAVYNVNNTGTTPTLLQTYSESTNTQWSRAFTNTCGNGDYFADFYIPLSALPGVTSSTQLRMVATTSTSPAPTIGGTKSDINGVNDDLLTAIEDAWTTIIQAEPPFTPTNIQPGGSGTETICTAAPAITGPLASSQTSITGTWTTISSQTTATISVYKNNVLAGTTTATSGMPWTLGLITLVTGDSLYAKALASGESQCLQSDFVVVQACTPATISSAPVITCASDRGIQGTCVAGSAITIYKVLAGAAPVAIAADSTTFLGTSFYYNSTNSNGTSPCSGAQSDVVEGTYYAVATQTGKCASGHSNFMCVDKNPVDFSNITATITISQASLNDTSTTVSGMATNASTVRLFKNGIYVSSVISTGAYSFTGLYLSLGDVIEVTAQLSQQCMTAAQSKTVSCITSVPIITANANSFVAVGSFIKGTSAENAGAIVTIYNGSTGATLGNGTVLSDGTWTSNVTAALSTTYKATQTYASCGVSNTSATVSTLTNNTVCPVIANSPVIIDTTTIVTGTVTPTVANQIIYLYEDDALIGSTVTSSGTWTITVTSPYSLYTNGQLSATSKTATSVESACAASVTVACAPPAAPVVPVTAYNTTCINTSISVTVNSTVSNLNYTLRNNAGTADFSNSVLGTGGTIILTSYPIASSQTMKVYASKFGNDVCETATSISVTTINISNLSVEKTVNNATPYLGNNVVFRVIVSNLGPCASTNIVVADTLPSGYAYVSYTANAGTYSNSTHLWTISNLASGSSDTLNITATANATGNYTNTASVTSDQTDTVAANNTSSALTTPSNPAPVANNDATTINEDAPVTINLTTNDTDVNGPVNAATVDLDPSTGGIQSTFSVPSEGTYTVNGSGEVTFTPVLNFNGTTTPIDYAVNDSYGATSNIATLTITVNSVNDAPVANPDATSTNENTPVSLNVTANDTDVDGTINVTTVDLDSSTGGQQTTISNAHGSWYVDNAGLVTFTPALNYLGGASISYLVNDNTGATSNSGSINIAVNSLLGPDTAPVATNDAGSTNEDTAVSVNVTTNDTDVNGNFDASTVDLDTLTAGIQDSFANAYGSWSVNASGVVICTPTANFNGTAIVYYTIMDLTTLVSNVASLSITVNALNDAPIANNDNGGTLNEDGADGTVSIITNDTDVDGNPSPPTNGVGQFSVDLDMGTLGIQTIVTNSDGVWTFNTATGVVTFDPANNFNGTATLTYNLCDTSGLCDNAILTFAVNSVNDAPIANNDATSTNEDTSITLNVTANDTDVDGTIDAATVDLDPSIAGIQTAFTVAGEGTYTVSASGIVTFTPVLNYNGTTTPVNYTVNDNNGATPNIATITITVNSVNDAPIANNDATSTNEDNAATGDVSTNDSPSGDGGNSWSLVGLNGGATNGTVTMNANGTYTYTPNANFNGSDVFTYTVCDNTSDCSTATLTIMVLSINDAPVANNNYATTSANAHVTFNATGNDTDLDGVIVSSTVDLNTASSGIQNTMSTAQGIWIVNASGDVTFTPALNFAGTAILPYTLQDDSAATANVAYLKVNVSAAECNIYTWAANSATYTTSGTYTHTYVTGYGIDTTTLLLTIRYSTSSSVTVSQLGCYTWALNAVTYAVSGNYSLTYTNAIGCDSIVTLYLTIIPGVYLNAKAILSGPYVTAAALMHDSLRVNGFIPTTEPYTSSPYNKTAVGGSSGETVSNAILNVSGSNAIIDWVFIELRDAASNGTVIANKRALIQRDGDIVSNTDGTSPVYFPTVANGNYYVSIKHRNHLGVMSLNAISFSGCSTSSIDFTTSDPVYTMLCANPAQRKQIGSVYALWAGDANNNKNVKYNGLSNDKDALIYVLGISTPNNTVSRVYRMEDVNLDGKIRYNNTDNDRIIILNNVGVSTPNNVYFQHTPN